MTELIIALASSVLLGVVWGVRQEGRITTLDQRLASQRELVQERHEALRALITDKFDDQSERLARIERAMNGYLRRGDHG